MNEICGIYCIEAIGGNPEKVGWKYVGQSNNCKERFPKHFGALKHDKHHSPKLQRYYNKYGKDVFQTYIVSPCQEKDLNFWEKWFVKTFDSYKHGFNCTEGGEGTITKPGRLQNIITKEIISFNSYAECARKLGIFSSGISSVIAGREKSIHNWCLPENIDLFKSYEVVGPDGAIFTVSHNKMKFCREHNIKNPSDFHAMLLGKHVSIQGWKLLHGREVGHGYDCLLKIFKVINPEGKILEDNNQTQFCYKHNLSRSRFSKLIQGKINSYKGWRLYTEETCTL